MSSDRLQHALARAERETRQVGVLSVGIDAFVGRGC